MRGFVLLLFFALVQCKFLIEYVRKIEVTSDGLYTLHNDAPKYEKQFYNRTDYHVAATFEDAKKWINLGGRYETVRHSFFGEQRVDPIEGFQFVALYNCSVSIPLLKKQIGLEKKIVHIKEEVQIPVYEYVSE